jgi:hypothetical protein
MSKGMVQPKTCDFDEMTLILRETEYGRLLDSFIRVEYGQDNMMAAWDAFRDIGTYFDEEYEGGREMVSQFLMTLEEEVPFSDMGMNAWI